jgi:pimeloyl-ACP methyl ester carboxylesterase
MKRFLLIHGSWHGAWCWHKVAPRLKAKGHIVSAPDLPGRIQNPAKPIFVSLKRMAKSMSGLLPEGQRTTIVVHSRYGILASTLAEAFPERIDRVIYLASYMLPSGKRAAEYFTWDEGSYLAPHVNISKVGMWDELHPDIYREGLYHDCNDDDNMLGRLLLGKEPLRPALAKLELTDDRFGQVPRAYIRLTEDRAVTPALQDRVLNETSVERVESISASHSAYFSKPDELTRTILNLVKS